MAEQAQTQESTGTKKLKEKLQQHLEEAKQRMDRAKQEIARLREEDKENLRENRAEIQQRIQNQQDQAKQLRDQASEWLREKKQQTDEQVASWRQKREVKHLERRAGRAEEYAVNAVVIAMMDADEAEIAVLDALDARLDADTASA